MASRRGRERALPEVGGGHIFTMLLRTGQRSGGGGPWVGRVDPDREQGTELIQYGGRGELHEK